MEGGRAGLKQEIIKFGIKASQFKDHRKAIEKGQLTREQLEDWITEAETLASVVIKLSDCTSDVLEDMAKARASHALVRTDG